jgi:hypothetical protein
MNGLQAVRLHASNACGRTSSPADLCIACGVKSIYREQSICMQLSAASAVLSAIPERTWLLAGMSSPHHHRSFQQRLITGGRPVAGVSIWLMRSALTALGGVTGHPSAVRQTVHCGMNRVCWEQSAPVSRLSAASTVATTSSPANLCVNAGVATLGGHALYRS